MGCGCLSRCVERFYSLFDDIDGGDFDNFGNNYTVADVEELQKKQELIIQIRPFNLGIFAIKPLNNGNTMECFQIKTKKNKDDKNIIEYKLHICNSTNKAIKIDEKIKLIHNNKKLKIMPYYFGRDNNFLLFKYLNDPLIYHQIISGWNQSHTLSDNTYISIQDLCNKLG